MPPFLKKQDLGLLKKIFLFSKAKKKKLYIIGGYLRDIILKRERDNPDIDFCLKRGAINFGQKLARELGAGFVILDKEHGACRLVKRMEEETYTLDFTDFRGKDLDEDLLHRDFTINTLAYELKKVFSAKGLENCIIDPYQGRKDLRIRTIRFVNKKGFDEDPLRILRAFSFSCMFDFKIDQETLRLIKIKKAKLAKVSFERIRDELFKILDSACTYKFLVEMDKLKILKIIFPEIEIMRNIKQGPYHHLDVWRHSLETVRQLEILIQELKNNQEIQGYLDEIISSERRRWQLIKLGALFHDVGKPQAKRREGGKTKFHGHERIGWEITQNIAKRLKLSNDELDALRKMVLWHLRPGYLADNEEITSRAMFRYFRDTAKEGASTLLISIADQRATKGPLTSKKSRIHHEKVVLGLIRKYFKKQKEKKLPRILTGDELMKKFKLEPSPLIGKMLSEIEELQAIGKIKTKEEAGEAARKIWKSEPGKKGK